MPLFRWNKPQQAQQPTKQAVPTTTTDDSLGNDDETSNHSPGSPLPKHQASSPTYRPDAQIKAMIEQAVEANDARALEDMVVQCKLAARWSYNYNGTNETLLAFALLNKAPLQPIQAIYRANPGALMHINEVGMSTLHQACTVATSSNVMSFLLVSLQQQGFRLAQLVAPRGWSVIHTACRLGVLPVDTFRIVIKNSTSVLGQATEDRLSTPLHLAIFGLERRPVLDQRMIILQLVQEYPYAVSVENVEKNTPIQIAQQVVKNGSLDRDLLAFLIEVQELGRHKYSTRVHIEERIAHCQAVLDISASVVAGFDDSSQQRHERSEGNTPKGGTGSAKGGTGSAVERRSELRQKTLAHIELQMLVPLRKKFMSEEQLRELIHHKTKQIESLPAQPGFFPERDRINTQIVELEKKLQRELNAKVPQEIQVTRQVLCERFRSKAYMPPINDVSLQYLRLCTNNFDHKNQLGIGGFGSVYHAYDAVMCVQYAVKTTDKYNDPSLGREVEILSRVFHPNIIRLFGFYIPFGAVFPQFLVFEYAGGGTISTCLKSEESRRSFAWSLRLSAAVGVASALDYLHNELDVSIAHHDIKPENIVFNDTLDRAMLIDCGISKVLKKDKVNFSKTKAGTPVYLPDDYTEDTPYDEKCEVFSFGLVMRVLISGRVVKSFACRAKLLKGEFEPDALAGWPPAILLSFLKLTEECVHSNPAERPSIRKLYRSLMDLSAQTEKDVKLTRQQLMTMNKTLTESKLLSRKSRQLEAKSVCMCSPKLMKRGLYCPGKKHFQCSECFNKYVLDYLGEEIFCPNENCHCSDAYTLEELHQHLKRSIICRHIEARLKNQELDGLRNNKRLWDEMGQGFDRIMRGISQISRDELRCPMLALLIPVQISGNRSMVRQSLRSWQSATSKTFFLFFVCAHDNTLVDAPIQLNVKKDWVKKVIPFLRAALIGITVAVAAAGIPISLPMLNFGGDGTPDNLVNNLFVLDQMLSEVTGQDPMVEQQMKEIHRAMQGGSLDNKMSFESYQMVADVANQPGNTAWRTKMVIAENNGELAWVKKENERQWKSTVRVPVK